MYVEVEGQEIEKHEFLQTDDGQARCSIDVQGEAIWSGKTKALIIIMPHYDNDIPQVINVGLNLDEIDKALDIGDGTWHDIETKKAEIKRLEGLVARLEIELEAAREESMYGNS